MSSALLVAVIVVALAFALKRLYASQDQTSPTHGTQVRAYILSNEVTHARLLPADSAHRFTYQTLSLFISLSALEDHKLDLGHGWLFGYGGVSWRISGLRADAYLGPNMSNGGKTSIKEKLVALLYSRGYDASPMHDAWMFTMPSYFGHEGINPLTVYYCYTVPDALWLLVLEIHNTFGEQHVHILEIGKGEDGDCAKGYDHQWTFHRQFHVSPFNDRSGSYKVSITSPSHAPSSTILGDSQAKDHYPPCPIVRIHLHTEDPNAPNKIGPLKLIASLHPVSSTPFTSGNWFKSLAHQPFVLLMSLPRILYQAWILHYGRRLDVYARPDPLPVPQRNSQKPAVEHGENGGGVGWNPETIFESFARLRVESFLQSRATMSGAAIKLIPMVPYMKPKEFLPSCEPREVVHWDLIISYQSSRFFISWLLAPSVNHLLLLRKNVEGPFQVSSEETFKMLLSPHTISFGHAGFYRVCPSDTSPDLKVRTSYAQRLRMTFLPSSLLTDPHFPIPPHNPTDNPTSKFDLPMLLILTLLFILQFLEKWISHLFKARFVPGQEPWLRWESAYARLDKPEDEILDDSDEVYLSSTYKLGSHRHDDDTQGSLEIAR